MRKRFNLTFIKGKSKVRRVDEYIEKNKKNVDSGYRHTFHAMPPIGWMNDPNGFCYAFGKYRLFYQFHPYAAKWGPMHWGHYTTEDFIKWNLEPTALIPGEGLDIRRHDKNDCFSGAAVVKCGKKSNVCLYGKDFFNAPPKRVGQNIRRYDKDGCFSGGAIVKDNELYLMYTAVLRGRQRQALAKSKDGAAFEKIGIVIENPPPKSRSKDFRDPKIFERGGIYYSLIGSRHKDGDGQIVLYKSEDILNWEYIGAVLKDNRADIYECPDISRLKNIRGSDVLNWEYAGAILKDGGTEIYECSDVSRLKNIRGNGGIDPPIFERGERDSDYKDILIASPQRMKKDGYRNENLHGNFYAVGALSPAGFEVDFEDELDGGTDFYAPQTLTTEDGRVVMIAWMQMWGRTMPTQKHGWAGAMILPRELTLIEGKLFQNPVREIEKYRKNKTEIYGIRLDGTATSGIIFYGTAVEIEVEFDIGTSARVGVKLFKGVNETVVYYDKSKNCAVFDRTHSGEKIVGEENDANIRHTNVGLTSEKRIIKAENDANIRHTNVGLTSEKRIIKAENNMNIRRTNIELTNEKRIINEENNMNIRHTNVASDGNRIKFRIFLDVSCVEIFINDGERVMTGNVYPTPADTGVEFYSEGGRATVIRAVKYDLEIK